MTGSRSPRPLTVSWAAALIWTQVVVGVVSAGVFLADRSTGGGDSVATLLVGQTVSVGLPAVLSVPLVRGRRWAEVAVLTLAVLGVALRAVGLGDDRFLPLGLFQLLSIACNLGVIVLLLLHPSRRFFWAAP